MLEHILNSDFIENKKGIINNIKNKINNVFYIQSLLHWNHVQGFYLNKFQVHLLNIT